MVSDNPDGYTVSGLQVSEIRLSIYSLYIDYFITVLQKSPKKAFICWIFFLYKAGQWISIEKIVYVKAYMLQGPWFTMLQRRLISVEKQPKLLNGVNWFNFLVSRRIFKSFFEYFNNLFLDSLEGVSCKPTRLCPTDIYPQYNH